MVTERTPQAAVFIVSGAQTLPWIGATHAALRDLVAEAPSVLVDCSAIIEVDLSFIQVLLAARRSAERAGKIFGLTAAAHGVLLSALQRGGLLASAAGEAGRDWWAAAAAAAAEAAVTLGR